MNKSKKFLSLKSSYSFVGFNASTPIRIRARRIIKRGVSIFFYKKKKEKKI